MSDGRVLMERDDGSGHRPRHARQPGAEERLRPGDARAARRVPRRARPRRRRQGRAAARRGRGLQHRRRHEQRLRLVRRGRPGERRAGGAGAGGRASAGGCSVDRKTFDFYHDFLGYPKVTVAEVSGFALGGGFELALMADISRRGPRHEDRDAGHPLPRAGAGVAPHVLPPPRPGARPAPAAHRRHHRGRRGRAPRRLHRGGRARPVAARAAGGPGRRPACPPTAS